jgi:cyclic pyranopterin phosphate synthase
MPKVGMVDISEKINVVRRATATGIIELRKETIEAIKGDKIEKGDVLENARIAAILGIKKTPEIIPMCHQIEISSAKVDFTVGENEIGVTVKVKSVGKTGVEMDAIVGASIALITIWDMVKSREKDEKGNYPNTTIGEIKVIEKVKE